MLRDFFNKSSKQNLTKLQLYDYSPPIKQAIQVKRVIDAGHNWWNKDELISDVFLWTQTHGHNSKIYIKLLKWALCAV